MSAMIAQVRGLNRAIGSLATARVLGRRLMKNSQPLTTRVKRGSSLGTPITLRPLDSDLFVASQIFGWEDYQLNGRVAAALKRIAEEWKSTGVTPLIIDGGANVGYSAVYFARAYPEATILAVEPDLETFQVLQRNTAGLPNAICIFGALWNDDAGVTLHHPAEGSWATNTAAATSSTGVTPSFTLAQLIARVPNSNILILKLDIEGAEREACDACPEVVASAPCLIVEPHDFLAGGSASLSPIYNVLAGKEVDTYVQGENLVFVDSALVR